MRERPTQAAIYTPGRNPDGKFQPGNQISTGHSNEYAKRLKSLKAAWLSAVTDEQMEKVNAELIRLCLEARNEDVRLRALIYFFDRTLGRPTENVNLDVNGDLTQNPLVNINLSPEELSVASKLVGRMASESVPAIEA